jgi:hypothetical protein
MKDSIIKIQKNAVEQDIIVKLPDGEEITFQYRNYEGIPSVDIILPEVTSVHTMVGSEMKASKALSPKMQHVRQADQITVIF